MSENHEIIPQSFEQNTKQKHERFFGHIEKDLDNAVNLLKKAKTEMEQGDLKSAWNTMEQVEQLTSGAHITSERLRISLRIESEK